MTTRDDVGVRLFSRWSRCEPRAASTAADFGRATRLFSRWSRCEPRAASLETTRADAGSADPAVTTTPVIAPGLEALAPAGSDTSTTEENTRPNQRIELSNRDPHAATGGNTQ